MIKTAEYVSIGHPDKTADFISSFILDTLMKTNPSIRYALEVLVKGDTVVLGGEIGGLSQKPDFKALTQEALRQIGYDERYNALWGDKALNVNNITVIDLTGLQSNEIAQGVQSDGWGDQGVFVGYATQGENFMPKELALARRLNNALYKKALKSNNLGLDIKTQITIDEQGAIQTAIAAVPMLQKEDLTAFIIETLGETPARIIVNGTGDYALHSAVADCGITGRKLACDFYSTACPIGGGSPWTKDPSKADLTLNILARRLALAHLKEYDECFVYLSSCIGRAQLPSAVVKTVKNGAVNTHSITVDLKPSQIIALLGLDKPIYADLCKEGLMSAITEGIILS